MLILFNKVDGYYKLFIDAIKITVTFQTTQHFSCIASTFFGVITSFTVEALMMHS